MKGIGYLACAAVVALASAGLSGRAHAADAELVAKAKKEGKVVYYTTRVIASMNALAKGFEAKYGIKVEASRHTNEDMITKITNESAAGRPTADIFDGSSGITLLMDAGLVVPYRPKEAEILPEAYKDPKGHWTAANLYVAGISHNTDLVKAEDLPKKVDDLLDPKWHGRKIIYTMQYTVSGINGFYGWLEKERGPEKAREFIAQLHKNGAVAMNVTPAGTADALASGQAALCIGCNANQMAMMKGRGAPVEFSRLQPIVSFFSVMGVTKSGANPNAARLFLEYTLSEEGQLILDQTDQIPVRPGLKSKLSEMQPGAGSFDAMFVTPEMVGRDLPRWNTTQTEVRK